MSTMSAWTDEELTDLAEKVYAEQLRRKCAEFIPGLQSCDMGNKPHDEHGYTTWHHDGRTKIRITWKRIDPT